jgi:hypothetical protein
MKLLVSVLAVSLILGGCSEQTQLAKAKSCIGNQTEVSSLSNLSADLNGVNKAINESSELGSCLVKELGLSSSGTNTEKAQRVLDFVKNNINYKVDQTGTRLPAKSIVDEEGDCEDMTALSGTLLKALDVDFYLIHKESSGDSGLGHVYAGIKTDEKTGLTCGEDNLKVIDASNKSAIVGVRSSNAPTFKITCELGGE